jgi:hypothetical protein
MKTEVINIRVDAEMAKTFKSLPEEDRRKIEALLSPQERSLRKQRNGGRQNPIAGHGRPELMLRNVQSAKPDRAKPQ